MFKMAPCLSFEKLLLLFSYFILVCNAQASEFQPYPYISLYTPTQSQDKNYRFLRWIHRRMLKQLERREPEGRPECQLLRRTPRLGCGSPKPGASVGSKYEFSGQDLHSREIVGIWPSRKNLSSVEWLSISLSWEWDTKQVIARFEAERQALAILICFITSFDFTIYSAPSWTKGPIMELKSAISSSFLPPRKLLETLL